MTDGISTNSSIQPWLDFHGKTWPATVPGCQSTNDDGTPIASNCTTVCDSFSGIFENGMEIIEEGEPEMPNNLLTCGLWATMTFIDFYGLSNASNTSGPPVSLISRFESLGLNASNATYTLVVRNTVSTVIDMLAKGARSESYMVDSSPIGACSEQALFPVPSLYEGSADIHQRLQTCVSAICAPDILNPDLGGNWGKSYPTKHGTLT